MSEERIEVVELTKPGIEFFKDIKGTIGLTFGIFMLVAGIMMVLSVVMIIPGFLGILVGAVFTFMNAPKSELDCRACGMTIKIAPPNKKAECDACGTITPIKWISRRKYNKRQKEKAQED